MVDVNKFFKFLNKNDIKFFSGVPDSVLKNTRWIFEKKNKRQHIITANEGSAIASCIGYFLATGKIPCAYMQNSGLSNALNPLISIANKKVYSIPLILIIGWRGSPKVKDEPQHNVKGKITIDILRLLNIKYTIVRKNSDLVKFNKQIKNAKKNNDIVACLIEQSTLEKNKKIHQHKRFL